MRTKTLLLTAALTAASTLASLAQVYSVNIVGYINLTIPSGFTMIANQLNASPDNTVPTLFPAPPDGTFIYKWLPAPALTFTSADYVDGAWEGDTSIAMSPGEGVWIYNPSGPFTQTFVGEVQLHSTLDLPQGYQIVSSVIPQKLPISQDPAQPPTANLGFVPSDTDTIYQWIRDAGHPNGVFVSDDFTDGAWEGYSMDTLGTPPQPEIGSAFWVLNNGSAVNHWTRDFSVGP